MTETVPKPVFIVGALRSGTTLLRLMLGMHPSLGTVDEFDELLRFLADEGWISFDEYQKCLATDPSFLAKELVLNPDCVTFPELARDLWLQHARKGQGDPFGVVLHSGFSRCPEIWPNARYIHLIRDPRDVALSCVGMGWAGHVVFGIRYWLSAERQWRLLTQRTSAEQRHEVRYEDLVRQPESTLAGICDFLAIQYSPSLLEYPQRSTYLPPNLDAVEQWRTKLSPREIELIEWKVGVGGLQRSGYVPAAAPTALPPGAAERARLHLQDRLTRISFRLRRYGMRLWTLQQLAKLTPNSPISDWTRHEINKVDRKHWK